MTSVLKPNRSGHARRLWAVALLLALLAALPAHAATIVEMPPGASCKLRLSGEIMSGDADRVIALSRDWDFEDESTETWRLCLDSPGGNLAEALRIAAHLRERGIGTVLEAGAECLSACALVFMMGFAWGQEDEFVNRRMHYSARLGFHRPELVVSPDQRDLPPAAVIQAFELALDAALGFVELANKRANFNVAPMMQADLLERIFSHRGTDFFYIDRVDHIGRWNIALSGVEQPRALTPAAALRACDNLTRWQVGLIEDVAPTVLVPNQDVPRGLGSGAYFVEYGSDQGMVPHACVIAYDPESEFRTLRACGDNDLRNTRLGRGVCSPNDWMARAEYGYPWIALFDAGTPLAALPELAARRGGPGATPPPARISPDVMAFRRTCHVEPGRRLRVQHVNEYATLRARPSFEADVVAQVPLWSQLEALDYFPVLPSDPGDTAAMDCAALCRVAHRPETVAGFSRINQCFTQNRFWYRVQFRGQSGYISARLLGP